MTIISIQDQVNLLLEIAEILEEANSDSAFARGYGLCVLRDRVREAVDIMCHTATYLSGVQVALDVLWLRQAP